MANIWSCDVLPKISFLFQRMLFLGFIFRMKHAFLITTWDTAIQEGVVFFSNLSSVQLLSHVWLFAIPWSTARQASLSFTNSRSLLKLMFIELVMPSNHLILCLSPPPPALNLSQHQGQVSSNESVLRIRWPKYWSLSFTISPSNEYSGLISFRNPRDSQESSPTPQFTSINSSALSFHFVKYHAFLSGNLFLPLNEASQPDCEQR